MKHEFEKEHDIRSAVSMISELADYCNDLSPALLAVEECADFTKGLTRELCNSGDSEQILSGACGVILAGLTILDSMGVSESEIKNNLLDKANSVIYHLKTDGQF